VRLPGDRPGQVLGLVLFLLPLVLFIWVLVLIRTLSATRTALGSRLRFALASELGLSPRELINLNPTALRKLRDQVAYDDLTNTLRRSTGVAAVEREVARSQRRRSALSVAFIDVDGLKRVNDTQGHSAGDELLKRVARLLTGRLRAQDLVFRYGGDEFVCMFPDTEAEPATRLLGELAATARNLGIGFSYGVAARRDGDDAVTLLGRADSELYAGRELRRPVTPRPRLGPRSRPPTKLRRRL
jgi:diguanylate cyclase